MNTGEKAGLQISVVTVCSCVSILLLEIASVGQGTHVQHMGAPLGHFTYGKTSHFIQTVNYQAYPELSNDLLTELAIPILQCELSNNL